MVWWYMLMSQPHFNLKLMLYFLIDPPAPQHHSINVSDFLMLLMLAVMLTLLGFAFNISYLALYSTLLL